VSNIPLVDRAGAVAPVSRRDRDIPPAFRDRSRQHEPQDGGESPAEENVKPGAPDQAVKVSHDTFGRIVDTFAARS